MEMGGGGAYWGCGRRTRVAAHTRAQERARAQSTHADRHEQAQAQAQDVRRAEETVLRQKQGRSVGRMGLMDGREGARGSESMGAGR